VGTMVHPQIIHTHLIFFIFLIFHVILILILINDILSLVTSGRE